MLEQRVCELDSIDRLVWKASDQMKEGRGRKKQVFSELGVQLDFLAYAEDVIL